MATITVRNLPEQTRRRLKERAARNNRSMEAEARAILEVATADPRPDFIWTWLEAADSARGELPLPERSTPREVELS